jgi:hypothetical protein
MYCDNNSPCASNHECINNSCISSDTPNCSSESTCKDSKQCYENKCVQCTDNMHCDITQTCSNLKCINMDDTNEGFQSNFSKVDYTNEGFRSNFSEIDYKTSITEALYNISTNGQKAILVKNAIIKTKKYLKRLSYHYDYTTIAITLSINEPTLTGPEIAVGVSLIDPSISNKNLISIASGLNTQNIT